MNTEERFKKDIWWLLQELKKDEMSTARSEYIHFEYTTGSNKPTIDDQRRAIRFLIVTRSIDVEKDVYPFPFDAMTSKMSGIKPSGHLLELRKPTFDKVYEVFEWVAQGKNDTKTTDDLAELMKAEVAPGPDPKATPTKPIPKLKWLDALSENNLEKFRTIIAITLEELEITGINRLTYNKISISPYQRAGFGFDEVKKVLGKINAEESGIIVVSNDELKKKISSKEFLTRADNVPTKKDFLETFSLVEDDLDNQLIVRISTLESITVLKHLEEYIDGKIQKPVTLVSSPSKTPEQKQLCVLEKINAEFKLGVYSDGMVDIAASDFSDCGVDRDQLTRMIGKFQREGLFTSYMFIDGSEAKYEEEYDYDVYRLYLPNDYMNRANLFLLSIVDPHEHARFTDLQEQIEDMRKNPEKYRKQSEERNKIRKEYVEKIYSSVDYFDPVEKVAWQMKWDLIQFLWLIYTSNSKKRIIRIPIKEMTERRTASQVSGMLEGLQHEGCFHEWQIFEGNYDIYFIDEKIFTEIYGKVKDVIKSYSENPTSITSIKKDADLISVSSLSFSKNTGDFTFNDINGNLTPNSQEFFFLKTLFESKDYQCDYKTLISKMWSGRENSKSARSDMNIVVRNIKGKLGILPKIRSKNPDIIKSIKNHGYRIVIQ